MFRVTEEMRKKWTPVIESADAPKIADSYREDVTIALLEQQSKDTSGSSFVTEAVGGDVMATANGQVQNWDPVLIALVRRAMPQNIGFDLASVQPMSGPTGQIFCMRSNYLVTEEGTTTAVEAFREKPNTAFSGKYTTAEAEALKGSHDDDAVSPFQSPPYQGNPTGFKKMGFTIDKATATAKSRALRADYTREIAEDLKAIHGLDAEAELASILSTEIVAEMNQEIIDLINVKAKTGAQNAGTAGTFDLVTDADGRWAVERFKSLQFQLEIEANTIAQETRRGRGNWVLCSANVASALSAAGVLNTGAALSTGLNTDVASTTYAGNLGTMKVYIDPFAVSDYATIGYKGANPYDAGVFYCPYIPLSMMRAVGEEDFQPRIGFKTRYDIVTNPFTMTYVNGVATNTQGEDNTNKYFRRMDIVNINVGSA